MGDSWDLSGTGSTIDMVQPTVHTMGMTVRTNNKGEESNGYV